MDRVAVFFAAVVPALLLVMYGAVKSRTSWDNEALWSAFFLGAVAAIGALLIELVLLWLIPLGALGPFASAAVTALFIAGIPEETVKFVVLLGAVERHVDVRRLQDLVALALAVSLGFAAFENILYLATPADWQWIAAARAITAVPGHAINGLVMGSLHIFARLRQDRTTPMLALALVIPTLLHAAYDFPLLAMEAGRSAWLVLLWIAVVLLSVALAIGLCEAALRRAAVADSEAGRGAPPGAIAAYVILGSLMLIIGPLAGFLALHFKGIPAASLGLGFGLLPVVLGLHLIWSGIRYGVTKSDS